MAQSNVAVTAGSGTLLDTWTTSKGGSTVHAGRWIPAEYPDPSYAVSNSALSTATAASHLLQLMAGASNTVRIRRIWVAQASASTSSENSSIQVIRLTTAGTGGTALTPAAYDLADSASGAAGRSLTTAKGTEGTLILNGKIGFSNAQPTGFGNSWAWEQHAGTGPIVIPAGTSNGIAIKNASAVAGGTVNIIIEFVETLYTK